MSFSRRLSGVSAFLLGAALFYAPLAYGCTRPEMLPTLYLLLVLSIAAGAAGMLTRGAWPAIPRVPLLCVAAVLVQGWWLTASPVFSLVVPTGGLTDTTPENIRHLSFEAMLMITLTLSEFLVLCDVFTDAGLRRFVLLAATMAGILICVIGVVLKLGGEPLMRLVWKPLDIYWNDFALFRYHGNAGAFLNLVWPLILVFTRRAWDAHEDVTRRVLWMLASLICAAALFLNASKAALVIGLLILPWPFASFLQKLDPRRLILLGAGMVLLLGFFLYASSTLAEEAAFSRLTDAGEVGASMSGRLDSYNQDLAAVPAVGWFGLGPGLYQVAFPYQNSAPRNVGIGIREYAQEDYLQTVLEWGWLGTVWWTVLVFGGLWRGFHTYRQRERFPSRTERHLLLAALLGVMGTLAHALLDFPLQVASLRLFFLVLLAVCWASPRMLTAPAREPRVRFRLAIPEKYWRGRKRGLTTSSRAP